MSKRRSIFISTALSLVTFFAACSKDDNDDKPLNGSASISARIGGKQTDLSIAAWAHQENPNSIAIVGHTAEPEAGKETSVIQIAVYNSAQKISPGTYVMDSNGNYSVLVTFTVLKADGSQVNFTASEQSASPYDAFAVKITSINGGVVKGTFGGKVAQQSGNSSSTIEITDGQFSVPVK